MGLLKKLTGKIRGVFTPKKGTMREGAAPVGRRKGIFRPQSMQPMMREERRPSIVSGLGTAARIGGRVIRSPAARTLGAAGLVIGGLAAAEQVAERIGVRGGAGFIGRRPEMMIGIRRRRSIISKRALRNIRRVNSYKKQITKAAKLMGLSVTQRKAIRMAGARPFGRK